MARTISPRFAQIPNIEVVEGEANAGFAANVNRGLRAADPKHDVVILNSDVIARPGWLECLQYAASQADDVGIVGGKLLYPDGTIQSGGTSDTRTRLSGSITVTAFKHRDWRPANIVQPALAVTGACMYVSRRLLDRDRVVRRGLPDGL